MEELTTYLHSRLAKDISARVTSIDIGKNWKIVPVVSPEVIEQILKSDLGGFDYRVKIDPGDGYASMIEGLAFDPRRVRSQAFALYENGSPVGVMTAVIAPRAWIAKKRYFQKEEDGARVVDVNGITGEGIPEYYIIPSGTKVLPSHRTQFAFSGYRAFNEIMQCLQDAAPANTWMEAVAQGKFPYAERAKLITLSDTSVNTFIPTEELPFDPSIIGENNHGSSSAVKMAKLIGLKEIENLGSNVTLGPVFVKRVR